MNNLGNAGFPSQLWIKLLMAFYVCHVNYCVRTLETWPAVSRWVSICHEKCVYVKMYVCMSRCVSLCQYVNMFVCQDRVLICCIVSANCLFVWIVTFMSRYVQLCQIKFLRITCLHVCMSVCMSRQVSLCLNMLHSLCNIVYKLRWVTIYQ